MEVWQGALLLATGCVAGFLNVMAGGGSLLAMPVMVFIGMPGPVANGTNRVAILVQNISATAGFFRQGFSDFRLSLTLALCTLPGAVLGAYFGTILDGVWFNRVLAGVMIAVLILMLRKKRAAENDAPAEPAAPRRVLLSHLCMLGVGVYGGFIQAGVGFIIMAVLHRVLGLDLVRVNMHKVFIIGVYTILALAVFAAQGEIVWLAGIALATGNAIGGWIGSQCTVKKGERLIRVIFNATLILMAIKLLLS
jgi:uncharacterized membrane protein YfcA